MVADGTGVDRDRFDRTSIRLGSIADVTRQETRHEQVREENNRLSDEKNILLSAIGRTRVCRLWAHRVLVYVGHWRLVTTGEMSYFDDGVGEVTQQDVRIKFGKPHIVNDPFLSEETTWIYRYGLSESELDPMGVKTLGTGVNKLGETAAALIGKGSQDGGPRERVVCVRYVLTFDETKVLRELEARTLPDRLNPESLFAAHFLMTGLSKSEFGRK